MIWQNPWAWFGLLALAVPVLVHLLARQQARVQRFPTLRFLPAMQLVATRRSRLTDALLLAMRMLILLLAVAALAQPFVATAERTATLQRTLARAVLVDTSASMLRPTAAGEPALAAARREAAAAAGSAAAGTVIETADPAGALAGAAAWLGGQRGLRELVVFSDFQRGTLDAADLARLPAEVGIALQRVAALPAATPAEWAVTHGDGETVARVALDTGSTHVAWTRRRAEPDEGALPLLLHAAGDAASASAARRVALAAAALPAGSRPIVVAYPGYAELEGLLATAVAFGEPWMVSAVAALRADAELQAAARGARVVADSPLPGAPFVALARTAAHEPVALAAQARVAGEDRLLVLVRAAPPTLASAATIAAAARAVADGTDVRELEVDMIDAATLAGWERAPTRPPATAADRANDASDGRWLWLVVLALLGAETLLRRRRTQPEASSGHVA